MSQMFRLENGPGPPALRRTGIRGRPGLRITLLALATAILLLGATVAGIACYLTLGHG